MSSAVSAPTLLETRAHSDAPGDMSDEHQAQSTTAPTYPEIAEHVGGQRNDNEESSGPAAGWAQLQGIMDTYMSSPKALEENPEAIVASASSESKKRDSSYVEDPAENPPSSPKRIRTEDPADTPIEAEVETDTTRVEPTPATEPSQEEQTDEEDEVYELGPDGLIPIETCMGIIMDDDEDDPSIRVCTFCL
jgi:hypothetical protein